MNFSQGHSRTKVRYVNRACFPKEKTPEFAKKGEIHELFIFGPFFWFAGATPDFCCVQMEHPICTQEKGILLPPGRSKGLFRKMTLVFLCFAVYANYEKVSFSHGCRGRFRRNSPGLLKYPNGK